MSIVQGSFDACNSVFSRSHLSRVLLALMIAIAMFVAPLVAATALDAETVNELPGMNVVFADECEGDTCG
ncbi:hypothetical protein KFU94_39815 [Chloroflexi bacterium TSY]|nr:hypothetical protein [Chloroflexi bacterium TSY]